MSILTIVVVIIIVGVLLYLVNAVVPMDPKVKLILQVVVVVALLLWLLSAFGVAGPLTRPLR